MSYIDIDQDKVEGLETHFRLHDASCDIPRYRMGDIEKREVLELRRAIHDCVLSKRGRALRGSLYNKHTKEYDQIRITRRVNAGQTSGFKERFAELHLTHRGMRIYRGSTYDLGLRIDTCNCFNCRNPHLLIHFIRGGVSADVFKEAFHSVCNDAGLPVDIPRN